MTQWKTVPVEPTPEMLDAARNACNGRMYPQDFLHGPRAMEADRWRAMIKAAPQQILNPSKKLIGWRTENYLWETDDIEKAKNWEPNIGVIPIFECDPNTKLTHDFDDIALMKQSLEALRRAKNYDPAIARAISAISERLGETE